MTDRAQLPVTGTISGLAEQNLINDALLALATQFYSATAPATTHPCMRWADTANMVLWERDSADSAWILRDTLDLIKTISKTGTYTALLRDVNKVITCAGTFALNLTAVATLTAAWKGIVRCTSGAVTITPAAGTINGTSTLVLSAGQSAALSNDGTNWFADISFTANIATAATNDIGVAGQRAFGVGICPTPPENMAGMSGYTDQASDNYGNYQYADGSIMCWIPAHYVKWGTGANGFAVNVIDIKPLSAYANEGAANADGYMLPRAFYDNGAVQPGFFYDKYKCSNNGGIASSIRFGNPLSSAAAHNPFSGLTGAPANFYYGAIAAAKTRGANFFPRSLFMGHVLWVLSIAHAQASSNTTYCAWYDATYNTPKGCNNNALGDDRDASILYLSDGYGNSAKTGSANHFARTTHNGQNCGVADVNGLIYEISPGLTTDPAGTTYYVLKPSAAMKSVTGGTTLATDLWGATGIAALYDSLGATYGALLASSTLKNFGSATQVFSEAVNGNAWNAAGAGIPLVGGVGGTNAFGSDGLWDYRPADMCPLAAGDWDASGSAGPGALNLGGVRGNSSGGVGLRAALYL